MEKSIPQNRWQKLLLSYWLAVPVLFYGYLVLMTLRDQVTISQLIVNIPGMTVGFLITCLMLMQAVILYAVSQSSVSKSGLLGKFLWFSLVQQILTGNIPGAILSFLAERRLYDVAEKTDGKTKLTVYAGMAFVGLISVLVLFVMMQMNGVK